MYSTERPYTVFYCCDIQSISNDLLKAPLAVQDTDPRLADNDLVLKNDVLQTIMRVIAT